MLVIRKVDHVPGSGAYVVVNVTTGATIFGPATYSECAMVVEYGRAQYDF